MLLKQSKSILGFLFLALAFNNIHATVDDIADEYDDLPEEGNVSSKT